MKGSFMKKYLKTCLFISGICVGSLSAEGLQMVQESTPKATIVKTIGQGETDALIAAAKEYQTALESYLFWPEGKKERALREALRDAYLHTKGEREQILEQVKGLGDETTRRVAEWNLKIDRNLLEKSATPTLTTEEFTKMAAEYAQVIDNLREHTPRQNYIASHHRFKALVVHLIQLGVSPEEIVALLKENGIDSENVLGKASYWKKKDLE